MGTAPKAAKSEAESPPFFSFDDPPGPGSTVGFLPEPAVFAAHSTEL
jgi:hypothetical protein